MLEEGGGPDCLDPSRSMAADAEDQEDFRRFLRSKLSRPNVHPQCRLAQRQADGKPEPVAIRRGPAVPLQRRPLGDPSRCHPLASVRPAPFVEGRLFSVR